MPDVGLSRQPRMFIRVDLPEPEGPMIGDEIAALDLERNPLQHVHRHLAQLVILHQVPDFDECAMIRLEASAAAAAAWHRRTESRGRCCARFCRTTRR